MNRWTNEQMKGCTDVRMNSWTDTHNKLQIIEKIKAG